MVFPGYAGSMDKMNKQNTYVDSKAEEPTRADLVSLEDDLGFFSGIAAYIANQAPDEDAQLK